MNFFGGILLAPRAGRWMHFFKLECPQPLPSPLRSCGSLIQSFKRLVLVTSFCLNIYDYISTQQKNSTISFKMKLKNRSDESNQVTHRLQSKTTLKTYKVWLEINLTPNLIFLKHVKRNLIHFFLKIQHSHL